MNMFTDSFRIFGKLRTAQKLVFLRVFIVINVSAFFLATTNYFESDNANTVSIFIVYALETCFMLWLGFKRGQRYHYEVGTGTSTLPTVRKVPMAKWYGGAAAVSILLTVIALAILASMSDHPIAVKIIFFAMEVAIMGLFLLQGLRVGWSTVTVSVDNSMPVTWTTYMMGASSETIGILPNVPLPPDQEAKVKKRAKNIKRGQVILGCISVVSAAVAIYFHVTAHEMSQPVLTHETSHSDTTSDPAVLAVARAFGDDTASSQPAQGTPTALAPVQPSVPEAGSAAALAEQGAAPAPQSPATIPADGPALATTLAIAANVAKEDPNDIAFTNGEDTTSLQTPVFAGRVSQAGYPVYALQCDFQKQQCTYHNDMGNPLVEPIADGANGLTPIRNADVINTAYHCQENICMDSQSQVVGTISLEMRNYLANHPSS